MRPSATVKTRNWLIAVSIISVLGLGVFVPWLVAGRVLAPLDIVEEMFLPWRPGQVQPSVHNHFVTDAVLQYVPYRMVMHESLRQDGYVGWNPLIFGGTAQHANTMLISHEVTMLLHRFLDFWTAWNLGRLMQFLAAGLGMLMFLRGMGSLPGVAVMGSVAYMLNHQFVAWIYFNQVAAAFCWAPWILWALHKGRDGNVRFVAAGAVFVCLALLGATLQQGAFVLAVLGCLWLGWVLDSWSDRQKAIRCTLIIGGATLLGAGMAAFALEPSIAAYLENERAEHGRGAFAYGAGWLQPLWQVVASPMTVYPFIFGSVQSLDLWKLFKFDIFNVGFFGTVPMLLAAVALFSRRVPVAAKLMMFVGVIVPLTPLVGYVYHRFNIVWILGGCWASATWLSQASDAGVARFTRVVGWAVGVCASLWLLISAGLWLLSPVVESWLRAKALSMAPGSTYGLFTAWVQERASGLLEYSYIWNPWQVMALGGLVLSLWGLSRIRSSKWTCHATAVGAALQLSVFWWQWTTWSVPEMPYGASALEKVLQERVGAKGRLAMTDRPWAEYVLPPNTLMPVGVAVTGGYDAMHPLGMLSPSGLEWDFPGTSHFLGPIAEAAPSGWPVIWTDGEWQLQENPEPVMGSLAMESEIVPLPAAAVDRPTFNTMEIVVPAGARGTEIFVNWHRGWEWRKTRRAVWEKASIGSNRTIGIDFGEMLTEEMVVYLRYNPNPPAWTLVVGLASLAMVLAVAFWGATCLLSPRPRLSSP